VLAQSGRSGIGERFTPPIFQERSESSLLIFGRRAFIAL
jgi:hypothetical protein